MEDRYLARCGVCRSPLPFAFVRRKLCLRRCLEDRRPARRGVCMSSACGIGDSAELPNSSGTRSVPPVNAVHECRLPLPSVVVEGPVAALHAQAACSARLAQLVNRDRLFPRVGWLRCGIVASALSPFFVLLDRLASPCLRGIAISGPQVNSPRWILSWGLPHHCLCRCRTSLRASA